MRPWIPWSQVAPKMLPKFGVDGVLRLIWSLGSRRDWPPVASSSAIPFEPGILDALAAHDVALRLYEFAGQQAPLEVTASFVYIRLHGPGQALSGLLWRRCASDPGPSASAPGPSRAWTSTATSTTTRKATRPQCPSPQGAACLGAPPPLCRELTYSATREHLGNLSCE
jgi:hypothetical protein